MALIKCKECGQTMSDRADACPHCGCPLQEQIEVNSLVTLGSYDDKKKEKKKEDPLWPLVCLFFALMIALLVVFASIESPSSVSKEPEELILGSWEITDSTGFKVILRYASDGYFYSESWWNGDHSPEKCGGTYDVDGTTLYTNHHIQLSYSEFNKQLTSEISFSNDGNTLTRTYPSGETEVYIRVSR